MKGTRFWLGIALASTITAACGDGDRLVTKDDPPHDGGTHPAPVDGDDAAVEQPQPGSDASLAAPDSGASTELLPVEAAFGGASHVGKSSSYQMFSRLAAPIGGGVAGEGTRYQMTTGVLALQGAEP